MVSFMGRKIIVAVENNNYYKFDYTCAVVFSITQTMHVLCSCRLLFSIYLLYLFCFTMSLGLAARSSDPREYSGRWDPLRLICEIASFLYLIVVIVMEVVVLL